MFDATKAIPVDVSDGVGHKIGTICESMRGRNGNGYWTATALDGCQIGVFRHRTMAEDAIFDDWTDGMPRLADGRLWQELHHVPLGIEPIRAGQIKG